jgi:hypothetical protein
MLLRLSSPPLPASLLWTHALVVHQQKKLSQFLSSGNPPQFAALWMGPQAKHLCMLSQSLRWMLQTMFPDPMNDEAEHWKERWTAYSTSGQA